MEQRHCKTPDNPFLPSFPTLRSRITHADGVQLWQDAVGMWISLVLRELFRSFLGALKKYKLLLSLAPEKLLPCILFSILGCARGSH